MCVCERERERERERENERKAKLIGYQDMYVLDPDVLFVLFSLSEQKYKFFAMIIFLLCMGHASQAKVCVGFSW